MAGYGPLDEPAPETESEYGGDGRTGWSGDQAAGFWLLEVDSRAEADEWGRRLPHGDVEIREVAESR